MTITRDAVTRTMAPDTGSEATFVRHAGQIIGSYVYVTMPRIDRKADLRHRYIADVHDWNGDAEDGEYDPITIGVFDDPESAIAEIVRRARDAQSPF